MRHTFKPVALPNLARPNTAPRYQLFSFRMPYASTPMLKTLTTDMMQTGNWSSQPLARHGSCTLSAQGRKTTSRTATFLARQCRHFAHRSRTRDADPSDPFRIAAAYHHLDAWVCSQGTASLLGLLVLAPQFVEDGQGFYTYI
jgi:hypothetical protein